MSQEETKQYFNLERKKHFEFFIPFYREKNWQLIRDNIDGKIAIGWDVELEVLAGQYKLVDEKVRVGNFNDFLLEIIQDMKTGKLGWFFSKKDWILYGSWDDIEKVYPTSLYLVKSKELKEYINNLGGFISTCISKKGWGNTWNIKLAWNNLIDNRIAEKLI